MKYEFTDDYLTGIASVDAQHSKLFDLTNELSLDHKSRRQHREV